MEMDREDFKLYDPLLSLLASVKNEEILQKEAKVAKVDFVLWRTVDILATGTWEH